MEENNTLELKEKVVAISRVAKVVVVELLDLVQ